MDAVSQPINGDIGIHRHHYFLDEVSGVSTHDVATHDLARLSVDYHLDQPVGLGHRNSLAVATEEGFLHDYLHAPLSALIFSETHHRQFGNGEHGTGHDVQADVTRFAQD